MIDEQLWNRLYTAAEAIYKHFDSERGFYSGTKKREDGSTYKSYNQFKGAADELQSKLGRELTLEEQAVLAIAVGDCHQKGLRKVLTGPQINVIFEDLWDGQPNYQRVCIPFDRLVTCI